MSDFKANQQPPRAYIKLSSGRIIAHTREENGCQLATPTTGDASMTDAEWEEYCNLITGNKMQLKTYPVGTKLTDRGSGEKFAVTLSGIAITDYEGDSGHGTAITEHLESIFEVEVPNGR
jgi:hypothetical protein